MVEGDRPSEALKQLRRVARATALLYAILALAGGAGLKVAVDLAQEGQQAHDAVCALVDDLERRIVASEAFLEKHPKGTPGIDAETIKSSITSRKQTIAAIARSGIKC